MPTYDNDWNSNRQSIPFDSSSCAQKRCSSDNNGQTNCLFIFQTPALINQTSHPYRQVPIRKGKSGNGKIFSSYTTFSPSKVQCQNITTLSKHANNTISNKTSLPPWGKKRGNSASYHYRSQTGNIIETALVLCASCLHVFPVVCVYVDWIPYPLRTLPVLMLREKNLVNKISLPNGDIWMKSVWFGHFRFLFHAYIFEIWILLHP